MRLTVVGVTDSPSDGARFVVNRLAVLGITESCRDGAKTLRDSVADTG